MSELLSVDGIGIDFGGLRAVMIEGPSREAIELVEVKPAP